MRLGILTRRGASMVTPTAFWMILAAKMSAMVMRSPRRRCEKRGGPRGCRGYAFGAQRDHSASRLNSLVRVEVYAIHTDGLVVRIHSFTEAADEDSERWTHWSTRAASSSEPPRRPEFGARLETK